MKEETHVSKAEFNDYRNTNHKYSCRKPTLMKTYAELMTHNMYIAFHYYLYNAFLKNIY